MIKLCYKEEKMNFLFNLFNLFIFIGFATYSIYMIGLEEDVGGYIGILFMILLLEIFYIVKFVWPILKNRKKYRQIKRNGKEYKGYINSFNYEKYINKYLDTGNQEQFRYTINIKYGENSIYKTPELSFNPVISLGSRECKIYVFNNEVYATDFTRRKLFQKGIWDENDESILNYKNIRKEYFEKNKIGIIVAVLFLTALFSLILFQILNVFFSL